MKSPFPTDLCQRGRARPAVRLEVLRLHVVPRIRPAHVLQDDKGRLGGRGWRCPIRSTRAAAAFSFLEQCEALGPQKFPSLPCSGAVLVGPWKTIAMAFMRQPRADVSWTTLADPSSSTSSCAFRETGVSPSRNGAIGRAATNIGPLLLRSSILQNSHRAPPGGARHLSRVHQAPNHKRSWVTTSKGHERFRETMRPLHICGQPTGQSDPPRGTWWDVASSAITHIDLDQQGPTPTL